MNEECFVFCCRSRKRMLDCLYPFLLECCVSCSLSSSFGELHRHSETSISYCPVLSRSPAALIIASQRSSSPSTMPLGYCFEGSRGLRGSEYFSGNMLAIEYYLQRKERHHCRERKRGDGHTDVEVCIHQSRLGGLIILARSTCTGIAAR